MDFIDSTRIVFNRVKRLEPEIATEIIGCILLQEPCEQDMVHLAVCPDVLFQEVICRVKADLHLVALKLASTPITPSMNSLSVDEVPFQYAPPYSPFSPCASFHFPPPYWDQHQHHLMPNKHGLDIAPLGYSDSVNEIQNQSQILGLQEQMEQVNLGTSGSPNEFYYPDPALSNFGARSNCRFNRFPEIPVKSCHYFNKGFCKHGNNCRYLHDREAAEGYSRMFGHNLVDGGFVEDHVLSPGSLQKLELEIVELLKSRRGNPISIASLPMLYHETYQKALQGDGYLTESQRHGKAGYSLTKLLARLKNSIRLIDRPHGQHAVILAEDAPKYMDNWNDRSDPGPIVSGSRQIYLTFPAESTFSEDDVSNYFSTYGPVEDVRIPCQQKRMFGFVTFASADTVKTILGKGNPHFVCGARVLVKPYREKSKLGDRKYQERMVHPMYFSRYLDMDSGIHSVGRGYETVRFFRKQHILEQKQALELERRRLAGPHLMRKPLVPQQFYGSTLENFRVSEDHLNFPSEEHFSYLLDVLNSGSNADDRVQHAENIHADQQSCEGLNLPDSPLAFAAPVASGNSSNA